MKIIMEGVREHAEKYEVALVFHDDPDFGCRRWVIHAQNQGGYDSTAVDFLDLLDWLKKNKETLPSELREAL